MADAIPHMRTRQILLAFFVSVFTRSLAVIQLNRTCPIENLDAQTGRCKVTIAVVPQQVFAFPTLDGQMTHTDSKSLQSHFDILRQYQERHPVGQPFSDAEMLGCKDMAMPCPTLGVDMELMARIFGGELDWDFTLVPYYTYLSAFYAARVGIVDMAWFAATITAKREACFNCPSAPDPITASSLYACCCDFSAPYWEGGLAVVSAVSESTRFHEVLFSHRMFNIFTTFVVLLIIVGHGMWLIESRSEFGHVYFPKPYTKGVFQGIYWACTTATTVGYGDTGPTTGIGKIFTMLWMFVGIVMSGIVAGLMSSALTVQDLSRVDISSLDQLSGQRLCFVAGATEEFVNTHGAGLRAKKAPSLAECLLQLERGSTDAILFDKPWLDRYKSTGLIPQQFGVSALLNRADYGVVFPEGSSLTHRISAGILGIMSDVSLTKELKLKWQGKPNEEASETADEGVDWVFLVIAMTMLAWICGMNLLRISPKPRCLRASSDGKSDSSCEEAWRTPGFEQMESMFLETITELRSDHADVVRKQQELLGLTNEIHSSLDDLNLRYSPRACGRRIIEL